MCEPVTAFLASTFGTGAATAAGATGLAATKSAFTIGSVLRGVGTIAGIVGPVVQGVQTAQAARQNQALIEQQQIDNARIGSIETQRRRAQFRTQMATQVAQAAGRGLSLDSPTTRLLGRAGAQEMAYDTIATQSGIVGRQQALSAESRAWNARARQGVLAGGLGAAAAYVTSQERRWAQLS